MTDLPTIHRTTQPTDLDQIVRYEGDRPVTAEEHILSRLRMGFFTHEAVQGAHVTESVYYAWLRKGAEAASKIADGKRLTGTERRYRDFAQEVTQAQDDARTRYIGTIGAIGVGGLQVTSTTTKKRKTKEGVEEVVEIIEKTETLPPNVQALTWIAERRWAKDWNRREQVEISGPDGGPVKVASAIAALDAELEQAARRQQAAIEVTATEAT